MEISVKIVHLTSVHAPFDTRIFHKEAKTLRTAGYTVIMIVSDICESQIVDGIWVKTLPVPSNRLIRFTRTTWQVYQAARKEAGDLYHFHDPELLPVGWLLSIQGKKVIYDVHEDVPKDILTKHWIPGWMRKGISWLIDRIETFVVHRLAGVVTATPAIARRFPAHKTVVVQNFPILDELYGKNEVEIRQERVNKIVYIGGLTSNRGVYQMLEAVSKLPPALHARLVWGGKFSPAGLAEKLKHFEAWDKVEFLGWIPREQLRGLLQEVKIGLVLFHPDPNHLEAQPNKLFEFMSAGLPVVASDFPLWREIVEGAGCGLLVDPLDIQAIAEAIQWLLEHPEEAEAMGKRGRQAVESHYNWETESEKLLHFYDELLSRYIDSD
jgi:glycosyltransferase involved in cell wall biosynthesis